MWVNRCFRAAQCVFGWNLAPAGWLVSVNHTGGLVFFFFFFLPSIFFFFPQSNLPLLLNVAPVSVLAFPSARQKPPRQQTLSFHTPLLPEQRERLMAGAARRVTSGNVCSFYVWAETAPEQMGGAGLGNAGGNGRTSARRQPRRPAFCLLQHRCFGLRRQEVHDPAVAPVTSNLNPPAGGWWVGGGWGSR